MKTASIDEVKAIVVRSFGRPRSTKYDRHFSVMLDGLAVSIPGSITPQVGEACAFYQALRRRQQVDERLASKRVRLRVDRREKPVSTWFWLEDKQS